MNFKKVLELAVGTFLAYFLLAELTKPGGLLNKDGTGTVLGFEDEG